MGSAALATPVLQPTTMLSPRASKHAFLLVVLTLGSVSSTVMAAPPVWIDYEVWGSDQSNSVPGQTQRGVHGSWIWIWEGQEISTQVNGGANAVPVACAGMASSVGPCDTNAVFPATLVEFDANGIATGNLRPQIGRLHGMLVDPQQKYITANFFTPGGGFVGILDGRTKEAIALFRASATNVGRSNHMSFWDEDGSAILIANLNGKLLERIDVTRNAQGDITAATFVEGAGIGIGQGLVVTDRPKFYLGNNLAGHPLIGSVTPGTPDLGELTPNGDCRENGCASGPTAALGGRPNNLIICPIPAKTTDHVYVTLGAGGMFVVDHGTTPMAIVGEYGNQVINGAGCGGIEANDLMFINAGVSASPAGTSHSTYTIYHVPLQFPDAPSFNAVNQPAPTTLIKDSGNTATNGNLTGPASNATGQIPGTTTRRDSHGMALMTTGQFMHTGDRIQNEIGVTTLSTVPHHNRWYDLTSRNGSGQGVGACADASVTDDPNLPTNDPAPDLMDVDPNGEFLFIAFRGPVPISADHSSQGSCPGVGVVALNNGGSRGSLDAVLRTTNTIDTVEAGAAPSPGGHTYTGAERSDVHAAAVRRKVETE